MSQNETCGKCGGTKLNMGASGPDARCSSCGSNDAITTPNTPEPTPVSNSNPAVWDLVVQDMLERDKEGRRKYGVPLQAHNGRNPLIDAYQEALDLSVYLRQAIAERQEIDSRRQIEFAIYAHLEDRKLKRTEAMERVVVSELDKLLDRVVHHIVFGNSL